MLPRARQRPSLPSWASTRAPSPPRSLSASLGATRAWAPTASPAKCCALEAGPSRPSAAS
eukprot:6387158-Pyramimonas_sp.AAC.1